MLQKSFLTINDLELEDKTVFVRSDMNSPINPETGRLLEYLRIKETSITVKELSRSKVVVGSHQGRVGRYDYVSLREHAEFLEKYVGRSVKFVEDIFGPAAKDAIRSLKIGEVLVLDNLRFAAEENFEFTIEQASKTHLVRRLSECIDVCVLDCFPAAHRANPSIVGFATVKPTCAGRLVERELSALSWILNKAEPPYTIILGGAKVADRLEAMEALIEGNKVDKFMLCGLISLVFLKAAGILDIPLGIVDEEKHVKKASKLLSDYKEYILLPEDFAIEKDSRRLEVSAGQLKEHSAALDIGTRTISSYFEKIKNSKVVIMSGPPGVFEKEGFELGTRSLLESMTSSGITSIVSGAHSNAALEIFGLKDRVTYATSAGGAFVIFLAGKRLPLIGALEEAGKLWRKEAKKC